MLPINDLARHAQAMQEQLVAATARVLRRGWYVMGHECAAFEAEFAAFCGVRRCVGVGNGTDAIEIALRALGLGRGARVATVANAGFYSSAALAAIGAEPVFVDVDPADHLMDLRDLRRLVAEGAVDAVVVTHLYGLLHDMEAVMAAAARPRAAHPGARRLRPGARRRARRPESRAASATPPRSASIRPRTWAPSATRGPS